MYEKHSDKPNQKRELLFKEIKYKCYQNTKITDSFKLFYQKCQDVFLTITMHTSARNNFIQNQTTIIIELIFSKQLLPVDNESGELQTQMSRKGITDIRVKNFNENDNEFDTVSRHTKQKPQNYRKFQNDLLMIFLMQKLY